MSKTKTYKKRNYCYATWGVAMIFLTLILSMSIASNWGMGVNVYSLLMVAVLSYLTFSKRVSELVQSFTFVFISMINIFIYSYLSGDLYSTIIVICALSIFCSFYMNVRVLILLMALSVAMLITHVFVIRSITFSAWTDVVSFLLKVIALAFEEVFLTIYVHRLCKTEQYLKESVEKAKRAEHTKSDFLANMSHEIRTPMNAIIGMCELILREDISEEVRENCFNIQNSGRSLLAIINDILDFSKIESGKAELIESEFNIGSTINDVINMANTRKGDKNIEIIARIDPNLPKGLMGDEVRIKQVMINLMTNAIKFTNEGCVRLKITQNRHDYGINLNVSVKDTGIGISEENLEKLFTSFQQVDTRKNRSVEGTGLGLAISKRLIAKMGGFINVSSTYGKGSEFKFVIPLKVTDPEPFIYVRDVEKKKLAIFIDMQKYSHPAMARQYRKLILEMANKFSVRFTTFSNMDELKAAIATGEYTHCIIAKEEYCRGVEYFNELGDRLEVLVVQDKINAIDLPENIKCIYKPFYSLSVASVLNNEKFIVNINQRGNSTIRFTAPDAKILIVDDNVTNLKVAEGLMKPYNMRIITALSGKEAIEALKTQDYDIVFMDHMMPEMDGVEATRIIRGMEGEYYKKLPIVALTANAIYGVREMFIREGFSDFIAKPIELTVLDRVLKSWLPAEYIKSAAITVTEVKRKQPNEKKMGSEAFRMLINVEKGLMYAGENQDTYCSNLSTYFNNGETQKESLDNRFAGEDWDNYVIEVHALKSSSLSIGAEKLSELAKKLEFAGKEGDYAVIKSNHAELSRLYAEVLKEVEQYLNENGYFTKEEKAEDAIPQNLKEITQEEFNECVERIRNACENFDEEGIVAIVDELASCSLNGVSLGIHFAKVKKLAEDFEYEQASEEAEKIAAEIAATPQ